MRSPRLALTVLALVLLPAAALGAPTIDEISAGLSIASKPTGTTAGPDGNLWFTAVANPGRIGRITPAGVITEFSAGLTPNAWPTGITAGPDGDLWFTEVANPGRIGRIGLATGPGARGPSPLQPPSLTPGPTVALGRSVKGDVVDGVIRVKVPTSSVYVPLRGSASLPVGSVIDSRRGRVSITSALPLGYSQTAIFWGGIFTVRQDRAGSGMTRLVVPRATGCRRATPPATLSEHAGRRPARRPSLWARDNHGRYETQGSNSVATVRGTLWQTVERCDGTLTRVRQGVVVVRDLRLRRAVRVTAGHSYLARNRR